tara:strand:- start:660 stop:1085 length:426 start_codon:yes stop_codon:yes gene_type:complete
MDKRKGLDYDDVNFGFMSQKGKNLRNLEKKVIQMRLEMQLDELMRQGIPRQKALKVIRADRYNDAFNQRLAKPSQREIDKDILIEKLLAATDQAPTTSSGQRLAMPATVLELLAGVGGGALIGALADDLLEEDPEPRQLNR